MNTRLTKNNFDLLRLLFSMTVCIVHAHQLSGFQQLGAIAGYLSSELAVKAFFVVSGFLIFMSYERSKGLASYFEKRMRRIYPAYAVVILLCAITLVLASSLGAGEYFLSPAWFKYVAANLAFMNFLQPNLPGVFASNPVPAVNGALWTLKIEVMFYLSVPLIAGLCRKCGRLPMLACLYALSIVYSVIVSRYNAELARQLPVQLSYFLSGAFFYYYLPFFERHLRVFLIAAVLALATSVAVLRPLALATVVIFCALYFYAGNFGKYGDFSYGFYILHFPIIQLFIWSGWFDGHPWMFLLSVVGLTGAAAIAMWHLVEKRCLAPSSHYLGALAASSPAPVSALNELPR